MIGIVALAAAGTTGWIVGRRTGGTHAADRVADRMIPATRKLSDGRESLEVTFPDGRTVRVEAKPSLGLSGLGAAAMTQINWPAPSSPTDTRYNERRLWLQYGSIEDLYRGAVPLRAYPSAQGQAQVFLRGDRRLRAITSTGKEEVMVIPLGAWIAEIDVRNTNENLYDLSDREEADLAQRISATTAADGFVRLSLAAPLEFTSARSMWLSFGDLSGSGGASLQLTPFFCGQPESQGDEPTTHEERPYSIVTWCDADTGLFVNARGPHAYLKDIAESLTVRPVDP